MQAGVFAFILAMFALAGFVKGVIGLGLPTISMGLLVLVMRPVEAAAVLVLPSLLTNVWQMLAGPSLTSALKALGLSFTVSTLALAVNVAPADAIGGSLAATTLAALAIATGGMWLGQTLRSRLPPLIFRCCFFDGLLLLGLYLIIGVVR